MAQVRSKTFCSVPLCTNSKQKQPYMSFHSFPADDELRKKWIIAIRRTEGPSFNVRRNSTHVCSAHFEPDDIYVTLRGKSWLKRGAIPSRFKWTQPAGEFVYSGGKSCPGDSAPLDVEGAMVEQDVCVMDREGEERAAVRDHDYVTPPTPTSVNKMSSEVSAQPKAKSAAEVTKREATVTEIKPENVNKPPNTALQALLVSPDLLSGVGKFACTVCNETCYSLAQLAKHVQFHDLDRPFPCVICGKRFLTRSHHSEHQRVHTGERPFPCNRCEHSFTTNHNLKRHQTIHNKEEMYRCTVCDVLFCQEHQLGNIGGIIRVLKQHSVNPEAVQKLTSLSEHQPAVEEQNNGKKRKFKKDDLLLDVKNEEEISQPSYHSEPHKNKDKDFSQLVHRTTPKIQKIAYDIEIII